MKGLSEADEDLLRRGLEKNHTGEELTAEEKATMIKAAAVVLAWGCVMTARLLKPAIDRIASVDVSDWFMAGRQLPAPRRWN